MIDVGLLAALTFANCIIALPFTFGNSVALERGAGFAGLLQASHFLRADIDPTSWSSEISSARQSFTAVERRRSLRSPASRRQSTDSVTPDRLASSFKESLRRSRNARTVSPSDEPLAIGTLPFRRIGVR